MIIQIFTRDPQKLSIYICVFLFTHMNLFIYVYIYVFIYMFIYIYVCMINDQVIDKSKFCENRAKVLLQHVQQGTAENIFQFNVSHESIF